MILRFTIFLAFLILTIEGKKYLQFSEEEQWQEFEEYMKWKKAKEIRENGQREIKYEKRYHENHDMYKSPKKDQQFSVNNPPPINQAALMARYIVNQAGKKIYFEREFIYESGYVYRLYHIIINDTIIFAILNFAQTSYFSKESIIKLNYKYKEIINIRIYTFIFKI